MREHGKAIVIITHKLNEVMEASDRVSVLRKGEYIGTVNTSETDATALTQMMVGKKVELNIDRAEPENSTDRLIVENINCRNREVRIMRIAYLQGLKDFNSLFIELRPDVLMILDEYTKSE